MWYNHAKAEAVFKQEWTQKEHICRESGMTDAQIQAIAGLLPGLPYVSPSISIRVNAVTEQHIQ